MSLEDLRNQSFPSKTISEWEKKAEASLKGKTIESLDCTTYEKIILKPLYSRQDEQPVPDYPAGLDFRRGIYPLGYVTNKWKVAQKISFKTPEELKNKLEQAVEKGQTALSFEVSKELIESEVFSDLLKGLYHKFPFAINSKWLQTELLSNLASKLSDGENVTGYVANDPISLFGEEGFISEEFLQEWSNSIQLANEKLPHLRTVLIDTTSYHNGGANAVQELGIATAEGVFYLQQLMESGMDLEHGLAKMVFQFSIGSNFFMDLAKLRAARVLWDRITGLYGAKDEACGMHITASTSSFSKTIYDPYVNLLRSANEAFAAVLGGIQYLHVDPFNEITGSNAFSERIARNMQLMLKEEAHLQKVIDPAGGSWYIETLTNQLAEKAWEFFQQIDREGGILEVLKSTWLQQEIASVYEKRSQDIQTRKHSIIGTNVYANLYDIVPDKNRLKKKTYFNAGENSIIKIVAIPQRRLSEPFEELRNKAKLIEEKTGTIPIIGMLCLGELKQHKARLDFMIGFLASGGIKAVESKPILTLESARQFVLEHPTNYVCFCGTNDQYEMLGHEILTALKAEFPEQNFYLAGLPEKDKQAPWLEKGIIQFIHLKSNCYGTLLTILNELEVTADEVAKA